MVMAKKCNEFKFNRIWMLSLFEELMKFTLCPTSTDVVETILQSLNNCAGLSLLW